MLSTAGQTGGTHGSPGSDIGQKIEYSLFQNLIFIRKFRDL